MFPRDFLILLARAAAGALLFSLPILLTMEMWWMGFTMQPLRTAFLLAVMMPILVGLAFYSGFEQRVSLLGATVDAFVALAVGAAVSFVLLSIFGVIRPSYMNLDEMAGKMILQGIVASFGAVLAASQMGGEQEENRAQEVTDVSDSSKNSHNDLGCYARELFLMLAGAIFLALTVAPTEEMVLVGLKMTAWHSIGLLFLSLIIMHGFVFAVKFHGQEESPDEQSAASVLFRFTIPGYAIALSVSFFCLWIFGRLDNTGVDEAVMTATVLAMPGAVGAASARLIL